MSESSATNPALIMLAPKLQQGNGILITTPVQGDTRTLNLAVKFATAVDVDAGTATDAVVTPALLKRGLDSISLAVATQTEVSTGTVNNKAVTPATLKSTGAQAINCTMGGVTDTLANTLDRLFSYHATKPSVSVSSNVSGTKYYGDSVTNITLTWSVTNQSAVQVAAVVFNGNTTTTTAYTGAIPLTGVTLNGSTGLATTYTVRVITKDGAYADGSATINFYYKVYYGPTTYTAANITAADVTNTTNKPKKRMVARQSITSFDTNTNNIDLSGEATAQHAYLAYPKALGAAPHIWSGDPSNLTNSDENFERTTLTINGIEYYVYVWIGESKTTSFRIQVRSN